MAKSSIQMINKTSSGNSDLYPITRDKEVKVVPSTTNNLPSTAETANDVFESLGKLAFADSVEMESEIDDTVTSTDYSWSSSKTNEEIASALSSAKSYTDERLTGDNSALGEHAATVGNSTSTGHVKLSDNYTSSDGDSSEGVGASSKALYDAYTAVNTEITNVKTAMNGIAYLSEELAEDEFPDELLTV